MCVLGHRGEQDRWGSYHTDGLKVPTDIHVSFCNAVVFTSLYNVSQAISLVPPPSQDWEGVWHGLCEVASCFYRSLLE